LSNSPEQDDKIQKRAEGIVNVHVKYPEKRIITISSKNEWKIISLTEGFPYTITFEDGVYSCTCSYAQFKGQCKHIKAIKLVKERGIYCPMNGDQGGELI